MKPALSIALTAFAFAATALAAAACGDDSLAPMSGFASDTNPGVPNTAGVGQGSPSTPGTAPGGGGDPGDDGQGNNGTGGAAGSGSGFGGNAGELGAGGLENNTAPGGPPGSPGQASGVPTFFDNVGESEGTQVPGFFGAGNDIGISTRPGPNP